MDKKLVEKLINELKFKFPYTAEDWCENLYLENYHCHKDFSNTAVPDCAESIENYAKKIKEYNVKCLYSGEHGSQGNQFEVYNCATKYQLKYRHSAEAYWVKDRHEQDRTNCHIVIVAKNDDGRKDLNYILSIANEDGYYYQPRIDLDLLLSVNPNNFIITSACIAGWKYEDAEDVWLKVFNHFKNNFFLELQNHNTEEQKELNRRILKMSKKYGIQIICGLDSHYVEPQNKEKREQIQKYKHVHYDDEDGWYMDYPDTKEVIKRFEEQGVLSEEEILLSILNTNIFVNECDDIIFDRKFKIPSIYKDKTYEQKVKIYKKTLNEMYKKESLKNKEKANGIRWEAQQVIDSGTVDYFLTSKKIIDDAVNKFGGILTTTSRGSAASFCTNRLLGLTTVDRFSAEIPIYPERFLTKERVMAGQMPDIDMNIAEQEPFIKAAKNLLGEHGCYPLMAIEKLKEKAAWQLYAGANDVLPETANQVSKYLDEYNKKIKHAEDDEKEFILVDDYIPKEYLDIYKKSLEYQGITINLKAHACGNLCYDGDIRKEIGLITAISQTTGKRTLCAAVEGKYLDDFGYVKEDFLIVDSVHLTYKFFNSIGEQVPSFEELKNMVNNDQKTWDIYANGITCCVNQCEKESTTNKVKKYKPKNIAELAAFIAGIRPGFSSLINVFLNREEYSTGEKQIDDLLSDSAHYMIFQESIMKVLSFLGLPMSETYGVIKSISKKKLKGEMKDDLMKKLETSWLNIFGKMDNFNNVWKVIESSAAYAFNSPHAYSMAGDSLYQAWFKAHHTAKFYEVAINHYQEKNKKEKISALIKEATKFYGYKLGNYKFGNDNRKVNIDEKNKIIYPNLSSVKGFGESVSETLFWLGKWNFKDSGDFTTILKALQNNGINKTVLEKLIKIDYFSEYGDINYLLNVKNILENFGDIKQIKKEKILSFGYDINTFAKYGNETDKQINKIDTESLLKELISMIDFKNISFIDKLKNQFEILGIATNYEYSRPKNEYLVLSINQGQSLCSIELYETYSGRSRIVKMWSSSFKKRPLKEGNIIYVQKIDSKFKKEKTDEINNKGKYIYKPTKEKEYWLVSYTVGGK